MMKQNERDVLKISKTETGRIRNNKNKIQKEKANGLPKTLNQDPVIHPHIYLRLKKQTRIPEEYNSQRHV
jgi:hypothetical protein